MTWRILKSSSGERRKEFWEKCFFSSLEEELAGGWVGGVKLQTGSPSRSLQLTQEAVPPPGGHVAVGSCVVLLMRPGTRPALTSGARAEGPSGRSGSGRSHDVVTSCPSRGTKAERAEEIRGQVSP